ncbi:MAG: polysaccharide deacetylase family protein [Methylobacter sp.]
MTFKLARRGFIIAISIIGLLHTFSGISLGWLALPGIIYLALIIYGSAVIQSNFHAHIYCQGSVFEKEIALSFDDGPNREYTPQVLSTLAQHSAPATFFVIGKNIQGNESILKQIDAQGHSIGNHSYTHSFYLDFKSVQGFKDELNMTAERVFDVIGKRMKLFRPPYGVTTPNLAKAANVLNYNLIGWSIRSLDTTKDSVQTITRRIQTQIKPGVIILFHDTSDKTVEVLKQTLDFAKENGYKFVSVEQLLKLDAYDQQNSCSDNICSSSLGTESQVELV